MRVAEPEKLSSLLSAVALGDRPAFGELYRLTRGSLFAAALKIIGDRDAAADILQEAYIRLWRRASEFDPALGSPKAWMNAVLRNVAIDHYRARRAANRLPGAAENTVAMPTDDDRLDISRSLGCLERDHAVVILRAFYGGLTHSELAEEFNLPLGTVKSRIKRGLAKLKDCLEHDD